MSESSLNDSQILRQTRYSAPDSKGRVQLIFDLPSGRKITSTDWLVPGEIKGKVLIAWADAIRAEDAYDIQERQEREVLARAEKRARESSSAARANSAAPATPPSSLEASSGSGGSSAETSKGSSTTLPDDPADMIYAKLQSLRTERKLVADQLLQSRIRLDVIERNISRWETVVSGLGLPSQRVQHEDNQASSQSHQQVASVDVGSNSDATTGAPPSAASPGSGTDNGVRRRGKARKQQLPRESELQESSGSSAAVAQ